MWPPLLLAQRPMLARVCIAAILPAAFGALCGFLLGTSSLWFQVLTTAGAIGGVHAGFEHVGWRSGLIRGGLGGVSFAMALLVTHTIRDVPALAPLPLALPPMVVFYVIVSMLLGVLGGYLRARRERQEGARSRGPSLGRGDL